MRYLCFCESGIFSENKFKKIIFFNSISFFMAPSPKPGTVSNRGGKGPLKAVLVKRVAELEDIIRKHKLLTPGKVLKVSCGMSGLSSGIVNVSVGCRGVNVSTQTGSAVLACVEVAVGPVCRWVYSDGFCSCYLCGSGCGSSLCRWVSSDRF